MIRLPVWAMLRLPRITTVERCRAWFGRYWLIEMYWPSLGDIKYTGTSTTLRAGIRAALREVWRRQGDTERGSDLE